MADDRCRRHHVTTALGDLYIANQGRAAGFVLTATGRNGGARREDIEAKFANARPGLSDMTTAAARTRGASPHGGRDVQAIAGLHDGIRITPIEEAPNA